MCQYHNDTVHINDALFILKTLIINLIIAAFGVKNVFALPEIVSFMGSRFGLV